MIRESKLWKVFITLSPTELKQFRWFLDSPYHNRREDNKDLFECLKALKKDKGITAPIDLWPRIYPRKTYSSSAFRHLMNYLLQNLEDFLLINQGRNKSAKALHLGDIYAQRGLGGLGFKVQGKALKHIYQNPGLTAEDLLQVFFLEQAHYNAHETGKRSFKGGLQEISDTLDHWFMIQKLRLACTMRSQQRVFQAEYDLALLEPVLQLARTLPETEAPLLALYVQTYDMLEGKETAYQHQSRLLKSAGSLLPPDELRTLSLMAINFCIQKLNQGQSDYLKEVYGWYKQGLEEQWLFEGGQLSPWTYKNIVSAGLKLEDFSWVERFLEQYKERLPEEERQVFFYVNLAELQLARGEFREVLKSLRFLRAKDPLTQLRARIAQIKAGLELEEIGLVESQLNNLKQLLGRKKTTGLSPGSVPEF